MKQPGNLFIKIFLTTLILVACNQQSEKEKNKTTVEIPAKSIKKEEKTQIKRFEFNVDSAYEYIKIQVSFGPRVPGTLSHERCRNFLRNKLKSFGFIVEEQTGETYTFDNTKHKLYNIMSRYKPELNNRILLCAHYDTRPFADKDSRDRNKPIEGANDGASGVAVILEIARQISLIQPAIGVDIVFFDLEDYGQPEQTMLAPKENTWCLGSQYFVKNFPWNENKPVEGILLDMVGAEDAVFPKEGVSMQYASGLVNEIWKTARLLGFSNYFINEMTSGITDDHLYLNRAGIPTVNIIHINPYTGQFGNFHHTHRDNLSIISKKTLEAVGQTLISFILSRGIA